MSAMTGWAHTHTILAPDGEIPVYLLDGAAYTREEWDATVGSDWTFGADGLLFHGRVIDGAEIRAAESERRAARSR